MPAAGCVGRVRGGKEERKNQKGKSAPITAEDEDHADDEDVLYSSGWARKRREERLRLAVPCGVGKH